jgi:tetratricopeptide (TPR) repeat protein
MLQSRLETYSRERAASNPNDPPARVCWCKGECPHVSHAAELLRVRRLYQAEKLLEGALIAAPECPKANLMLAGILTDTNRAAFASEHLRRAFESEGATLPFAYREANNLFRATRIREASQAFARIVARDRTQAHAWAGLLTTLEQLGEASRLEETAAEASKACGADHADLRRALALARASRRDYEGALALLPTGANLTAPELFDRGHYADHLGDYDSAWRDWMTAKRLLRQQAGHNFQEGELVALIAALKDCLISFRDRFIAHTHTRRPGLAPIFVCGFPRSGTTLIETILACHSAIVPADELSMLSETISFLPRLLDLNVPYPQCLTATTFGNNFHVIEAAADFYVRRATEKVRRDGIAPGQDSLKFFTDKMPLNEIHLPLIHRLFPTSKVLYVRRHPLDIVLSSMSYFITHGYFYAASPASAAKAFAMIDGLLELYRDKLPLAMTEIRYERLIEAQRETTMHLMFNMGLQFEPAQLDFHKLPRHSRTISHDQVRTPLYGSSVYRYKNYLKHLEPIVPLLAPIIEREGYTI